MRNPGHSKLLILGKPGAGKSTFLKHLTLQCIRGTWQIERIPIFVTLKDFAEATNQPGLLDYLKQLFSSYGVAPDVRLQTGVLRSLLAWNETSVEQLLREGRLLILLDGLDEVREADSKRVLKEIQGLADQFDKNQFVMTCRIAAKEYTFGQFTEVEIADFDHDQIAYFANQWFLAKNDLVKAERFMERLQNHDRIRELATNPLLLTLLCLVFEELGSFPTNRAELYGEGLDVLLKRWDNSRNIERSEVYQGLALQRKEDLLSQIAWNRFEQGDYFFKKAILEEHITQYIRNLVNSKPDTADLQIDSEAILKSIEAQHGLLVERAQGIYSFSHLTFQEYFAARQVKEERSEQLLQTLASHITEKRWREVFLLTVGMMPNADQLLRLMKQQIDRLLANNAKLQPFLHWVQQKAYSVDVPYKPAAVRAFYFAFYLDLDRALDHALDINLDRDIEGALDRARDINIDRALSRAHNLSRDLDRALSLDHARDLSLDVALDHDIDHASDIYRANALAYALDRASNLDLNLDLDLDRALHRASSLDPEVERQLQQVTAKLPDTSRKNRDHFQQWWQTNGPSWIEQLGAVLIEHRNIGHDWQFTNDQKRRLEQYYDANKLLVDCLNSDCYVSREVRANIESTLLRPVSLP